MDKALFLGSYGPTRACTQIAESSVLRTKFIGATGDAGRYLKGRRIIGTDHGFSSRQQKMGQFHFWPLLSLTSTNSRIRFCNATFSFRCFESQHMYIHFAPPIFILRVTLISTTFHVCYPFSPLSVHWKCLIVNASEKKCFRYSCFECSPFSKPLKNNISGPFDPVAAFHHLCAITKL